MNLQSPHHHHTDNFNKKTNPPVKKECKNKFKKHENGNKLNIE